MIVAKQNSKIYQRAGALYILVLMWGLLSAQAPPIEGSIRLSGTFGELRGDHYHKGIDIKSPTGRVGVPVYAVDNGYISSISVNAGGYGNSMQILHPDGHTSLYGHLLRFTPIIDSMVSSEQYKAKQFEVDITFEPDQLPVSRGELIGLLGSTGYSFGPHLHFEWTNTLTGHKINPLQLDWKVDDEKPPEIRHIRIYHLDYKYRAYEYQYLDEKSLLDAQADTLEIDAWRCGIGVESIDYFNGRINKNGIYSIQITLDSMVIYQKVFDQLSHNDFDRSKGESDYKALSLEDRYIYRCHNLQSSVQDQQSGIIPLFRDKVQEVEVTVRDFAGNAAIERMWLRRTDEVSQPQFKDHDYEIPYDQDHEIVIDGFSACFASGTFFEDTYCFIQRYDQAGKLSDEYEISPFWAPLQKPISISFSGEMIGNQSRGNIYIAQRIDNKEFSIGGQWKNEIFKAQSNSLGIFTLQIDSISPTINLIHQQPTSEGMEILVRIDDNIEYLGVRGITYDITIDKNWWLGIYDAKSKSIKIEIPKEVGSGNHVASINVRDYVGNMTERSFIFRFD